ncbi:MAG: hypothetical protein RR832_05805 [Bacilli bacterium]
MNDKIKYREINQCNMFGEVLKKWGSIKSIENELGISNTSINSCCRGRRGSAGGFKFEYADCDRKKDFKQFEKERKFKTNNGDIIFYLKFLENKLQTTNIGDIISYLENKDAEMLINTKN